MIILYQELYHDIGVIIMNNKIEKMSIKERVLHTSAKLFFEKGYQESTLREIANKSGVNYGSLTFAFKNKENILSMLIGAPYQAP